MMDMSSYGFSTKAVHAGTEARARDRRDHDSGLPDLDLRPAEAG